MFTSFDSLSVSREMREAERGAGGGLEHHLPWLRVSVGAATCGAAGHMNATVKKGGAAGEGEGGSASLYTRCQDCHREARMPLRNCGKKHGAVG